MKNQYMTLLTLVAVLGGIGLAALIGFKAVDEFNKIFPKRKRQEERHNANTEGDIELGEIPLKERLEQIGSQPDRYSPAEMGDVLRKVEGYLASRRSDVRNTDNTSTYGVKEDLGPQEQAQNISQEDYLSTIRSINSVMHLKVFRYMMNVSKHWNVLIVYVIVAALAVSSFRLSDLAEKNVPLQLLLSSWWDLVIVSGPIQALAVVAAVLCGVFAALVGGLALTWLLYQNKFPGASVTALRMFRSDLLATFLILALLIPGMLVTYVYASPENGKERVILFDGATRKGKVEAASSKYLVFKPSCVNTPNPPIELLTLHRVSSIVSESMLQGCEEENMRPSAGLASVIAVRPMAGTDEEFARVVLGCELYRSKDLEAPPTATFAESLWRESEIREPARLLENMDKWLKAVAAGDTSKIKIAVVGFTSTTGTSSTNLDLAERRANTLTAYMKKRANALNIPIPSVAVNTVALGDTVPYKLFLESEDRQRSATAYICKIPTVEFVPIN